MKGKQWALLTVGLALLSGFGAGVVADRMVNDTGPTQEVPGPWMWFACEDGRMVGRGGSPAEDHSSAARSEESQRRATSAVEHLSERLELSAEQRVALQDVALEIGSSVRGFWHSTHNEYCELQSTLRAQIRVHLTAEQLPAWDQWMAEYDQTRRERRNALHGLGRGEERDE